MKNKFITLATGSVMAASLLLAGTASAHSLALTNGLNVGVNANVGGDRDNDNSKATASIKANVGGKVDTDTDNDGDNGKHATSTKPALITGNGQPVIGGTVTAVNGNTLTVLTAAGVTYTVNATNSTVVTGHATTTASTIAVGSKVLVQGAVNGTSITATSVIASNATTTANIDNGHKGFGFGWIRGFLHSMFGFF